MEKRIDCPLCGKDVYPNSASGTARNDETGINFIVCIDCDGATHTPEPDNCDHKPQYGEWRETRGILKDLPDASKEGGVKL